MHVDVVDLRGFYSGPLGTVARRLIARQLRTRWPNVAGQTVIGLGYATPFLSTFASDALRIGALMPAPQGVVHWPQDGPFRTVLVDDDALPLPDGSVDRLLMAHALEMSQQPQYLLREAWRVLSPGGRLIAVVPNRRGMWARIDTTPFGFGRPYSRTQLTSLMRDAMFNPSGWVTALSMPPFNLRFLLRSATALERLGSWLTPAFAGVLIVEATKQVYAPVAVQRRERQLARGLRPVLLPPAAGATRIMPVSAETPPGLQPD